MKALIPQEHIEKCIYLIRGQKVMLDEEHESLRSQFVILKKGRGKHRKYLPFAFTEQGVAGKCWYGNPLPQNGMNNSYVGGGN